MGLLLRDTTGASYQEGATGMVFPIDSTGLEINAVFGGSLAASVRNLAPNRAALTAVGAPTINANSIVMGGGVSYLQSAMADAQAMTLVAIARMNADDGAFMFSNYGSQSSVHSGTTSGCSLYFSMGTAGDGLVAQYFQRAKNVGGVSTLVTKSTSQQAPVGAFQFLCGRIGADGVRHIHNLTNGSSGESPADLTQYDLGAPFRIGGAYSNTATFGGPVELVAAIGMSRMISDMEMNTLYQFWKGYCARRGIAI